ncbi:hypothetical protein [Vibrio sp. ER1A]|uniref:hypothetical protein n=1 Tax=Vibrio sp. ER1A TaxID=1517681 RepID=UPI0004DD4F80|nr:hypothetical protein [Vibrio sp. ER1A]KFA98761.1 hypothetical protein HW45_06970 [Vibrio sp. ER1A]
MSSPIYTYELSAEQRACLFRIEQQMVRQQGFINLTALNEQEKGEFDKWQEQGVVTLKPLEGEGLAQSYIEKYGLTHSCSLSEQMWIAASSLRRIYACDL